MKRSRKPRLMPILGAGALVALGVSVARGADPLTIFVVTLYGLFAAVVGAAAVLGLLEPLSTGARERAAEPEALPTEADWEELELALSLGQSPAAPARRLVRRREALASADGLPVVDAGFVSQAEWALFATERGEAAATGTGPVVGVPPAQAAAFCAWLGRAGETYRLPDFREADAVPARLGGLATLCRDGEELSLAVPLGLLRAVLLRPYDLLDEALSGFAARVRTLGGGVTDPRAREHARRLLALLERAGDVVEALRRDRERSHGLREDVAAAMERALPRRVDPGLPRDLPLALTCCAAQARRLVNSLAEADGAPDIQSGARELFAALERAARLPAAGDVGRYSTVATFIRYPEGIEFYARHVARRLVLHYAQALALELGEETARQLDDFVAALEVGDTSAARDELGWLRRETGGTARQAAALIAPLLDALTACDRPAASRAWSAYLTEALSQVHVAPDRTPGSLDRAGGESLALRLPLDPEIGGSLTWVGLRIVREG